MASDDIDDQERDICEVQCSVSPATLAGLDSSIVALFFILSYYKHLHFTTRASQQLQHWGSQLPLVECVNFLYIVSCLIGFP